MLVNSQSSVTTCVFRKGPTEGPDFQSLVHGPSGGLFTTDPAYWQTVHLGGACWEQQLAAQKAAEKQEWADKVVVKDIHVHIVPGTGDKASAPVRGCC